MTINNIIRELRDLTDTDAISMPAAALTDVGLRRINAAYEEVVGWIINADGRLQFDDTNYTDHPIGTGTLIEGQQDYAFASEYLQVEAVEILNTSSPAVYVRIKQIDHNELDGLSTEQYFGLTSAGNPAIGLPTHYDANGDTIRLYPAPTSTSVTLTAGIKIFFKRTADLYTAAQVTTGTKEPGFALYHIILAYMAALPYLESYKPARAPRAERKIAKLRDDILKHYAHKNPDKRPIMTNKEINYI